MSRMLVHYTTALLTLSLLAGLYLVTVDRWLQSSAVEPRPVREAPRSLHRDDALADLFPESAWQRGVCKRLKTSRGILLFQHWKQTSRNEWKLWPITLVVGRGLDLDDSDPPLIIDSHEGARIEFDQSLDIMSGGAPPIRTGEIRGEVHVWRGLVGGQRTSDDPAELGKAHPDTLDIRTSNLSINERKIWTTQAIEMRVGEAVIRGEDLTLDFAIGAVQVGSEVDAKTLLHQMELIYLHELTMPLDGEASLSVECGGRVRYDFSTHRLRLGESVALSHSIDDRFVDRFECNELELLLRDPMNQELERRTPSDWLAEVHAAGSPAVAKLQGLDCDFAADSIRLDAEKGEIRAGGSRGVAVRVGAIHAQLEGLVYSFDPARPERLGMLDARGSGRVMSTDPATPLRDLRWTTGLLIRNDSRPGETTAGDLLKVWIDGQVQAGFADGDHFHADAMEGDVRVFPEADDGLTADHPPSTPLGSSPERSGLTPKQWRPERFTASGNVRARASGIDAETESLQLFFVHRHSGPTGSDGAAGSDAAREVNSGDSPLARWIGQPSSERERSPSDRQATGADRDSIPLVLRGDVISAKLEFVDGELVDRDLTIQGSVELTSQVATGGRQMDARLTGAELRLREGAGESLIDLRGGAGGEARLELGDGFFVGPRVQVWPTANVIEIDAAGEFQLPRDVMPAGSPARLATAATSAESAGRSWRWVRPPRCRWNTAMTFDGRAARMLGGVRVEAAVVNDRESWDLYLTGEALQFDLQQAVQLSEVQTLRGATLQQVTVLAADDRPVLVEALRRGADGGLESRHLLSTAQLRFLPLADGRLIAHGPGWYRGWMREAFWGGVQDGSTAAKDLPASAAKPLTGVHLTFHEAMVGELEARSLEFLRGVRIGARSVSDWEEAFDVAKMTAIGLKESTLECERLRVQADPLATAGGSAKADWRTSNQKRSLPWELIADGGISVRTRNQNGLFECRASEAYYSTSKDRFIVRGSASRVAQFRRTAPPGQPGARSQPSIAGEFDTLVLRPEDMSVEDLQWRGRGITVGELSEGNRW